MRLMCLAWSSMVSHCSLACAGRGHRSAWRLSSMAAGGDAGARVLGELEEVVPGRTAGLA